MKKYYMVTFTWSRDLYCTNIAHAETEQTVRARYARYQWVEVRECGTNEVEAAKRRGMPIIEIC